MQTGETVFNERWAQMIGYTLEELQPVSIKTWEQFTHPEDLKKSAELLEMHFNQRLEFYDVECRMKHKNGHWIWVHDRGKVFSWTEENQPLMMFGSHSDVTERKLAEEKIQNNETVFQQMLTAIPDMISIHDRDLNIIYSNWSGFGAVPQEKRLLHTKCYSTYRNIDDVCPDCAAKKVFETKENYEAEHQLTEGNWINLRVLPIFDRNGEVQFFVEWLQDITERKRSEARLKEIEWMLSPKQTLNVSQNGGQGQDYGDLAKLNSNGIVLKSVGQELLKFIANDYMELLGTCTAIYEKNGDYAFGMFSSGWCRMMDSASRKLCASSDNVEALNSGRWLCHESCWTHCSRIAIAQCKPVDIECHGGIRIYCIPVIAGGEVVGAINFGYGDSPTDQTKLQKIADIYQIDYDDLVSAARAYKSRPPYIIEMAKKRLHSTARLTGSIIEKKQAEQALAISEDRLNMAMDVKNEGIFDWNLITNEAIFDDRYYTMAGYYPNEFPQKFASWAQRVHPDDLSKTQSAILDYISGHSAMFHTEFRFKHKNGEWMWILGRGKVVERDEDGAPLRLVGTHTDITQRKHAQMALEAEKERLLVTLRSIGDGVITTDKQGKIVIMNRVAEQLCGWIQSDAEGKPLTDVFIIINENTRKPHFNPVEKVLSTGNVIELENHTILISSDGTERPIADSGAPIRSSDGEIIGVVLVFRDMTEKYEQQSKRQRIAKLESLGVLAGGIAHDFNNILGSITGYADMALDETSKESRVGHYISQIQKSSERAADLVRQILTFSRQDEGATRPLFLTPVLREIVNMVSTILPSTIEVRTCFDKEQYPVLGNATRIHEAVMNLCVNAAHAMGDKGTLELRLEEATMQKDFTSLIGKGKAGHYSVIEVKDNGCGVPDNLLMKIFDPYFTTKAFGDGTGLGLSVVAGVMENHDGAVVLESEMGKGASFKLFFPTDKSAVVTEIAEAPPASGGSERILFVDDEEVLCEIAQITLGDLGYSVNVYSDCLEALEEFKSNPDAYDLIITDQTMPKMTGVELSKEIMRIRPAVPVILCTGFSKALNEDNVALTGIKALCVKPVRRDKIVTIIRDIFDSQKE